MPKVLIIDDDEMHLVMVRQILDSESMTFFSTADGPHGIKLFSEHRPDLVLLDMGLPSMSGIDVLKEIKKLDANAKVIVVTGYGSSDVAKAAERFGAYGFIQKPVDMKTFVAVINQALGVDPNIRRS
jgi:DNA-binding NtrC family response regulator